MQHVSCYWPFSSQFFGGFNFCRAHTLVFRLKLVKFAPIWDPIWLEVQTKSNYFGSKFCVFSCKEWLNQNPHLKKVPGASRHLSVDPIPDPVGNLELKKSYFLSKCRPNWDWFLGNVFCTQNFLGLNISCTKICWLL